jgi:geranylgeranyl diphosphate synthase type II
LRIKYPEETRALIDEAMQRYFPKTSYPEIIYEAMQHSLFSGGKRFRGILTIESGKTFGLAAEKLLPTACAIEYIHTYSLIHDDLPAIDNDDLRRGKPTCHIVFGEDIAILAGDALFAEAFYLISHKQQAESQEQILQVIQEVARATTVRGIVGGQVADVISTNKDISKNQINFIHGKKTGALIEAAARSGAILGNCSPEELKDITEYAKNLGLAFQITDDILDIVGETKNLGKRAHKDYKKRKVTYPGLFGLEKARSVAEELIEKAKKALLNINRDTKVLADLADFVYLRES